MVSNIQMKHALPVCLFIITALASVNAATPQTTDGWKQYVSAAGKFTALFPGEPTVGYRLAGIDSPTAVSTVIGAQTKDGAYIVAYFDLDSPPADAARLIDQTRDLVRAGDVARTESEGRLNTTPYPSRDFVFRTNGGDVHSERICVVRQRVYRLTAFTPTLPDPRVNAFFNSFEPQPLTDAELADALRSAKDLAVKAVPRKMRVSEGVLRKNAIRTAELEPVRDAAGKICDGTVQLRVVVGEDGTVSSATATGGPECLRDAAVATASRWVFRKTLIQGYPVRVEGELTLRAKN